MTRVLSGVQPTGSLHLGNYLGAIKNWVGMQNEHDCLFCIVDLHAITVPQDPAALRAATRMTAAAYIACGIDAEKSAIFHQSAVPEHAELAWLFSTITPLGWLNRMTQFKEKSGLPKFELEEIVETLKGHKKLVNRCLKGSIKNGSDTITIREAEILSTIIDEAGEYIRRVLNNNSLAKLGLFSYPVLMAADILLYNATHVPVGEDQKQHLELARDIAGAFNRQYKNEFFTLPDPLILGNAARVMSLRDGTKKMSKSDESDQSRINLTDSDDDIAKKIKKAKSDMIEGISYDAENRPEASNMLNIIAALKDENVGNIAEEYKDYNFSKLKSELADILIAKIGPIRDELLKLNQDHAYLDSILLKGVEKAGGIAAKNISQIKEIMGFLNIK